MRRMRIGATIMPGTRRDSAASLTSYTGAMEDMPGARMRRSTAASSTTIEPGPAIMSARSIAFKNPPGFTRGTHG